MIKDSIMPSSIPGWSFLLSQKTIGVHPIALWCFEKNLQQDLASIPHSLLSVRWQALPNSLRKHGSGLTWSGRTTCDYFSVSRPTTDSYAPLAHPTWIPAYPTTVHPSWKHPGVHRQRLTDFHPHRGWTTRDGTKHQQNHNSHKKADHQSTGYRGGCNWHQLSGTIK